MIFSLFIIFLYFSYTYFGVRLEGRIVVQTNSGRGACAHF